jgi:hypothetical protein
MSNTATDAHDTNSPRKGHRYENIDRFRTLTDAIRKRYEGDDYAQAKTVGALIGHLQAALIFASKEAGDEMVANMEKSVRNWTKAEVVPIVVEPPC